jgi:hypothetical protein
MFRARAIQHSWKSPARMCPENPAHREIVRLSAHHQHQEDQGHEADALKRVRGGFGISSRYTMFGRRLGSYVNAVADLAHLDALGPG